MEYCGRGANRGITLIKFSIIFPISFVGTESMSLGCNFGNLVWWFDFSCSELRRVWIDDLIYQPPKVNDMKEENKTQP